VYLIRRGGGLGIEPVSTVSAVVSVGKILSSVFGGGKEPLTLEGEQVIRIIEGTWHQTTKIPQYLPRDLELKYNAARTVLTKELNQLGRETNAYSNRKGGEGTQLWAIRKESLFGALAEKLAALSGVIGFDLTQDLWTDNKNAPLPADFVNRLKSAVAAYGERTALVQAVSPTEAGVLGGNQTVLLVGIAAVVAMVLLGKRRDRKKR
jgi:hypothetical protein